MMDIERDRQRHKERVKEAIRKRLPELVASEDIVTAPSGRQLRVPVRFLDDVRFRPARGPTDAAGAVPGGLPGWDHEEPDIEVGLSLEEVADLLFEELRLPDLKPRTGGDVEVGGRVEGLSRRGPMPRLDRRRTLLEHLKTGGPWHEEQFRFRDLSTRPREVARAVVVFVRDASGSMDQDKRYRVRVAAFWTLRWLRRAYRHAEPVFVVHDTAAEEVDEHHFFHIGAMGGTAISSGLALAEEILAARYPAGDWNRYVLFFSDGENWPDDNRRLVRSLHRLHAACELVAYGETVAQAQRSPYRVMSTLESLSGSLPRLRLGTIRGASEVAAWLRNVFGGTQGVA